MKIALTPYSQRSNSILSLLTQKMGLYTGPIPNISKFFVHNSKADAFLCPHNLKSVEKDQDYIRMLVNLSEQKPIIFFNLGDFPRRQLKGNFIFIQTGHEVGRNLDTSRTVIIPYNVRAIDSKNRVWRNSSPVLSFVGQVPKITAGRVLRSLFPIPPMPLELRKPSPFQRNSALIRKVGAKKILSKESGFATTRKYHGGSAIHVPDINGNRSIFESVMQNSDFVFSPRGDQNNSFRLYESISAGRIPVVPASSVYLPDINSREIVDIIRITDCLSRNLWNCVEDYWNNLDVDFYIDVQNHLRKTFQLELSYYKYLPKLLSRSIDEVRKLQPILLSSEPRRKSE